MCWFSCWVDGGWQFDEQLRVEFLEEESGGVVRGVGWIELVAVGDDGSDI